MNTIRQVIRLTRSDFCLCHDVDDYDEVISHQMTLAGMDPLEPIDHRLDLLSIYIIQIREVEPELAIAWSLINGAISDQHGHWGDNKKIPLARIEREMAT